MKQHGIAESFGMLTTNTGHNSYLHETHGCLEPSRKTKKLEGGIIGQFTLTTTAA